MASETRIAPARTPAQPQAAQQPAPSLEAKRPAEPRVPRRERGVQRHRQLLDALEELLELHHPDDIGIYQIAERAKSPPASTYHFFPTKEAAFVALAERYLTRFQKGMQTAVEADAFTGWLDLLARDSRSTARYFNAHRAALKLLIGRYGGLRVRELDVQHNRIVGRQYVRRLSACYHLPDVPHGARKFQTMLEIQDAVWAISYVNHGQITPEYEVEAIRASRAYIRLYYPEEIALKDEIRMQIAAGEAMIQPAAWLTDDPGDEFAEVEPDPAGI